MSDAYKVNELATKILKQFRPILESNLEAVMGSASYVHTSVGVSDSLADMSDKMWVESETSAPSDSAELGIIKANDPNAKRTDKKKLILINGNSPGDVVMMTAAVRDLHKTYPGEYQTDVQSPCTEIFEGNPYITKLASSASDVERVLMHYPIIHDSNEGSYHFIHGYRKHLEQVIGRPIKQGAMRPDLYIRTEERAWTSVVKEVSGDDRPFWIIDAGHKQDFTAKAWSFKRYQQVVDYFCDRIQFVQIGHQSHIHPKLTGVIDLVGQTDLRQLIRLFYHSSGVLTPVSLPMVLAAGVPMSKPYPKNRACVVIAGGREPVQWQAYPTHQFIHRIGVMPCCDNGGCWKSRVVPTGDGDQKDKHDLCLMPMKVDGQDIGACMDSISVNEVVHAIELFYKGGLLMYDTQKTIEHRYKNRDSK